MGLLIAGRRDLREGGTEALTGRVLIRDAYNYGTEALTGRASLRDSYLRGGGTYGTEALAGRLSLRNYGTEALTGRASLRDGTEALRDEPPYGTFAGRTRDVPAASSSFSMK